MNFFLLELIPRLILNTVSVNSKGKTKMWGAGGTIEKIAGWKLGRKEKRATQAVKDWFGWKLREGETESRLVVTVTGIAMTVAQE